VGLPLHSFSFHRILNSLLISHSVSAHDPSAPYHDPSSSPDNPKWSVVHVSFRQKLSTPITLKELKAWQGEKGHPLENMQMLKLARISVSKVSAEEWNFLVSEMAKNGDIVKQ
jgi:predicted RNA-binding protein with PUA-like domain